MKPLMVFVSAFVVGVSVSVGVALLSRQVTYDPYPQFWYEEDQKAFTPDLPKGLSWCRFGGEGPFFRSRADGRCYEEDAPPPCSLTPCHYEGGSWNEIKSII